MLETRANTLTIPTELLGLADVSVEGVRIDHSARQIIISVKSTLDIIPCRICSKPTKRHGVGRQLRLRHLPILGQQTIVEITPRRGQCEDCEGGITTTQVLDWYIANGKMTKPYEQHLLFELVNSTVSDVGQKEEVDYHAVESLIDRYIETETNYATLNDLGVVGIDEISLKKGYRDFITLITYRVDERVHVLGLVEGREKTEIIAFFRKIPRRLHKTIRAICCDLYDGFINASKEVFNDIPIVADRFHVRRLYRKSLINLRKSELVRLKKELPPEEYVQLKTAIAILRKHKDYFTDEEKPVVERLFSLTPVLKEAYHFSRELSGIFDSHITPELANKKLTAWINAVTASKLTCFKHFMKTLTKYREHIVNYFIGCDTSGFVEGFNNKVKVLKRRCYGLSGVTRLFQRLIVDTLGMNRFAPGVTAF